MAILVVQGNLNHCATAQDLLVQSMAQWGIQLAVVAEPYYVPPRSDWAGDLDGSVAIIVRTAAACPPLAGVVKGQGYVAATIGEMVVLGGYFSPNRRLADFEGWIEEVGTVVARSRPRPVLVLGDFNAKSVAWGSPRTCARGEALEEWAIEKGLVVLNRGSVHTCVRQQGGSIVDVTFASPELARRVRDWRVVTGVETLSDHRYIRFSVSARNPNPPSRESPVGDCPRWALQKLNRELFREALIVAAWASGSEMNPPDVNVEQEADNLRSLVTGVCDAAMPRRGRFQPFRKKIIYIYFLRHQIAVLIGFIAPEGHKVYENSFAKSGRKFKRIYLILSEYTKTFKLFTIITRGMANKVGILKRTPAVSELTRILNKRLVQKIYSLYCYKMGHLHTCIYYLPRRLS
ncbi:hypothetical protein K1T71_007470 [Dendrolimus kikuchii]|uniref:Uncharacterized protein n=1 Tax=Dendrolimus kikuchii TaxID=765133 RepID=A0ACC1D0S1_9NEOP|nr:hypothetical protein K1T71_007470 [Dendrolimus kikuchii]